MGDDSKTKNVVFSTPEKIVWALFLLLVFSLGFMQPYIFLLNNRIPLAEFLFLTTIFVWLIFLVFRKLRLRFSVAHLVILAYVFAMAISAVFSTSPEISWIKFLGVCYLAGLAFLTSNLVQTERHLKHMFWVWIAALGVVGALGVATVVLFYIDRDSILLRYTLHHYGTLPPGNYPRIQSTFFHPAMLCNYLSLGLMAALASLKLGWINRWIFVGVVFLLSTTALFSFSPGIGGIFLCVGIWSWLSLKRDSPRWAKTQLFASILIATAFFAATILSPIKSETSPFYVRVPVVNIRLDPPPRPLAWISSLKTSGQYPITGKGIGTEAAEVFFKDPSGRLQRLTDAHQIWLNILATAGVIGLLTLILLGAYFLRKSLPLRFSNRASVIKAALSIGFISAFFYQGLAGSYEDARHLWVWMGLIAAVNHEAFEWENK